MSIPTSGTYKLNIIKLSHNSYTMNSDNQAVYTLGSGENTISNNVNVTFNGSKFTYVDSNGKKVSITYNLSAGQGNYTYNSVIVKDPLTGDWYVISAEPVTNYQAGHQITHGSAGSSTSITDSSDWSFGVRVWNTQRSTSGFSAGKQVCFLKDTEILTPSGSVCVQNLRPGDEITTYEGDQELVKIVKWVGKSHCLVRSGLPDDLSGYPVRICKDALALNVPYKDLLITSEHCINLGDYFVPARMLVNGTSIIYDRSISSYDYYHVETHEHSVIVADGVLTESYLDTGNRHDFDDSGNVVCLKSAAKSWREDAKLPLMTDRAFVEPHHKRIADFALSLGKASQLPDPPMTQDPDLHLVTASGIIIRPQRRRGQNYIFVLDGAVTNLQIRTRSSRPCDVIGPFTDDRRYLGVSIDEIAIFDSTEMRLLPDFATSQGSEGWHLSAEGEAHWTDGNARISLGGARDQEVVILSIRVLEGGPYLLDDQMIMSHSQVA